jgi:uncharacterized membrane protein (UPF0127 family)
MIFGKQWLKSKGLLWVWIPWNVFLSQGELAPHPLPGKVPPSFLELKIGSSDCETGTLFHAKTVFTERERALGLSGRKNPLGKSEAMGFIFSPAQPARFWMKDTWIPLTILFFNESGELLSAQEMPVEADPTHPTRFYSEHTPVSLVLETAPGNALKYQPHKAHLCVLVPESEPKPSPGKASLKFQNLRKTVR